MAATTMPLAWWSFPVGVLGCNCTILACPDARQALVVDPGGDAERILGVLGDEKLAVVDIVHTHAHFDHVLATAEVAAAHPEAGVVLHRDDRWLWDNVATQLRFFGIELPREGGPSLPPRPTRELTGDAVLPFGRREARALHTPGHTPGSMCFYVEGTAGAGETPLLVAGDTLFKRSIGRTDLWGGSMEALARSIRDKLLTLPDETRVVTGHGPETSIGAERRGSPFIADLLGEER
jgi:glyoxylase-like metal-dependent hydrolase (beta-lactamase superfamily II)